MPLEVKVWGDDGCTALRYDGLDRDMVYGLPRLIFLMSVNTLRTGDADLRFYITTVQDG